MHRLKHLLWLCLGLSGLLPPQSMAQDAAWHEIINPQNEIIDRVGELAFRHCTVPSQQTDRKVQCAWLDVPENHARATGKTIPIFVVRLPARRHVKNIEDPVVLLAGGPGQSAAEAFLFVDSQWPRLAKHRDLYLIDQRGTGRSNPMNCEAVFSELNFDPHDPDYARLQRATIQCLQQLEADPAQYTTVNWVQDLERVRAALGVERWNVYGVSYGTRVATHYMRQHAGSIRSVVLDSPVYPEHVIGSEIAYRSDQAFYALLQACENDRLCSERMPDTTTVISRFIEALRHKPIHAAVEDFSTGHTEQSALTHSQVLGLIRLYLYTPETAALLPVLLYEAAVDGKYPALARAAQSVSELADELLYFGAHNAVLCSEEYPRFGDIPNAIQAQNSNTYLGDEFLRSLDVMCEVWPHGDIPENFHHALHADLPTLMLTGENDPITPPAYAERLKKNLPRATHFVLPGRGHSVAGHPCAARLISDFITEPDSAKLDSACLSRMRQEPVFVNLNGTAP